MSLTPGQLVEKMDRAIDGALDGTLSPAAALAVGMNGCGIVKAWEYDLRERLIATGRGQALLRRAS